MKKLTFKDVAPDRILDYDAMSKIRGGIDDEYGWVGGTCGIKYTINGVDTVACNLSQKDVFEIAEDAMRSNVPYWWCCDSCSTSSYCGNGSDGY